MDWPRLYGIHVLCCGNNRSPIETSPSLAARTEQSSEELPSASRTEADLQPSFCNLNKKRFCCFCKPPGFLALFITDAKANTS